MTRVPPLVRAGTLVAVVLLLVYPVASFFRLDDVPVALRAAWPAIAVAAWCAPRASLLTFLAASPLLHVVPMLAGWARVSLPEMWLVALLVPFGLRVSLGTLVLMPSLPGVPLFGTVATASLLVVLYPFSLITDSVRALLVELHRFASTEFLVAVSQRHLYASVVAWAVIAEGLALLVLIASTLRRDARDLSALLTAATAGAALVAGYGVWQWWTGSNLLEFWVVQDPSIVRINATFSDVNSLGAYLAMMIWIAVGLAIVAGDQRVRLAWRAASLLMVAALVFTASRAAWVAAFAGGATLAVLLWRSGLLSYDAVRARRLRFAMVAAAVLVPVTLGALTVYATARDVRHHDQDSYLDTVLYTLNLNMPVDERLKGRLGLWRAAVAMVEARPAFGIGIGRFYKELWAYAPDRDALVSPQENAHNYFLQTASELGLLGAAAFVVLVVLPVTATVRTALAEGERRQRLLAATTAAAMLAYVLTLITGHALLLREGQFAFWPVVAAGWMLADPNWSPARMRPLLTSRRLAVVAALAVLATVPARAAREASEVDLTTMPIGFHEQEVGADGTAFRWSRARGVLHVPARASAVAIPLRSVAPSPQTVTVMLDGQVADRVALAEHAWREVRYVLPRRRDGPRFHRIELHVTPTWRPRGEQRELGVMVGDVRWQEE